MLPPPSSVFTQVWLATPEAASRFDPSRLVGAEHDAWADIHTPRRRLDWASSRALLSAVPVGGEQHSSLSHSHGFAALALVPATVDVGVDLECLVPRNFNGMAQVAYSATESEYLSALRDPADLCAAFYEFWTLKEAFAKALRLPLVDALRKCRFIDSSGARRADIPTTQSWRATVFAPRPRLRLAVVRTTSPPTPISVVISTMEWPQPREQEWPVILDFEGGHRPGGRAC